MRAGKIFGSTVLAMGVLAMSLTASAEDVKVTLTGAEEVPAVTTKAMGEATLAIGKDMSVSGTVKTTGIEGVAAHIHLAAGRHAHQGRGRHLDHTARRQAHRRAVRGVRGRPAVRQRAQRRAQERRDPGSAQAVSARRGIHHPAAESPDSITK